MHITFNKYTSDKSIINLHPITNFQIFFKNKKGRCNELTLNEYQTEAMRTASGMCEKCNDNLMLNGAMGLNGEAGEVIDILKKYMFQGHKLDTEHIAKELGDCLWYIAVCAKGAGYTLDEIAEMNKAKLRKRYPDGFEADKSIHRSEGDI